VEILEMIIDHLIYDSRTLLTCSLTCYSWYIVVVPRIHHTLVTETYCWDTHTDLEWSKPLRNMHKAGLLPFFKKFNIRGENFAIPPIFSPKRFSRRSLRYFTSLTNVQELGIDHLDIPSFIPSIQRYFGHFSLTVHSLALRGPKGSPRQIVYFIGLFKHLEDLKLLYDRYNPQGEPADDPTLVPPFIPPLRGRLTATHLTGVGILMEMIDLFGGIRFRYMALYNVIGMRFLLYACAETLETLRLYPTDPRGKVFYLDGSQALTGGLAAVSYIRDFDLSQNKFLRTLEVTGRDIDRGFFWNGSFISANATRLFTYALSTITSPVFTELTVFYRDYQFGIVGHPLRDWPLRWPRRFEVFQMMRKVRDFQLVLCAEAWDRVGEYTIGVLKEAVAAEKVKRRFDDTYREPLVTYSPRRSLPQPIETLTRFETPWIPL
jgi:hypothetical protein